MITFAFFTIVSLCVFFSAYLSATETAMTTVSMAKIQKLRSDGNKRADIVSELRESKENIISCLLIAANTSNIVSSSLATYFALKAFGDDGVIIATTAMTVIIIVYAEVLPKTYALEHAEKVALAVAPSLKVIVKIMKPVTITIDKIVDLSFKLFPIRRSKNEIIVNAMEELRGAIELQHNIGAVKKQERDMLDAILDLEDTQVEEIMTHRKNVVSLPINMNIKDILAETTKLIHSKIPLWSEKPDDFVGILDCKALFRAASTAQSLESIDIKKYISEAWFVPDNTSLKNQLSEFISRKNHIAVVVDEYGSILGIVTLKDILEEIVGKFKEKDEPDVSKVSLDETGSAFIDASTSLRDLNRDLDWDLPENDASTIAGLIIHETARIPDEGEIIELHGINFEIIKKQDNQIIEVKINKNQ